MTGTTLQRRAGLRRRKGLTRRTPLNRHTPIRRHTPLTRKTRLKARGGMGSGVGKKVRAQVLERDGHRCVECGKPGDHDMSHCFPRSRYNWPDRTEAWNLDNLCRDCHRKLEAEPELREEAEARAFARRPKGRSIHPAMLPYLTDDEREELQNRTGGRREFWRE